MRTGPRPLLAHLGLTLSAQTMQQDGKSNQANTLTKMLEGIRRYQLHPFVREGMELECVWQEGQVRVLRCHGMAQPGERLKTPLLILPSMVNRMTILDLLPEQSFVRFMAGQGRDIYVLDWGDPVKDAQQVTLEGIFAHRLAPALNHIIGENAGVGVHILGYCMGGTLAAGMAQLYRQQCRSVTLLAAPWDFHAGGGDLSRWVQFWSPVGLSLILQNGYLPGDWMQSVFASLDPFQTAEKFAAFAGMAEDDPRVPVFVTVEDWLNDPVHLPGALARNCIQEWFTHNLTAQEQWKIQGQSIRPQNIEIPVCVIASQADRLVPYRSCMAIMQAPHAHHIKAQCGHIGFMASAGSKASLWPEISAFFDAQD